MAVLAFLFIHSLASSFQKSTRRQWIFLKKSSVQNGFERRLPHNSKVESQDRLLRWDLSLSGIHFSSLDGSARLVDVVRHLMSSAEMIITAASSDGIVRVVTFQLIPQKGSEVKISACGGHGFPVFSPPGHT